MRLRRVGTFLLMVVATASAIAPAAQGATLKPGDILVIDAAAFTPSEGGILRINPRTGKQSLISSNDQAINASSQLFTDPWQAVLTPRGKLLVADYNAESNGAVISVDPRTGKQTLVSSNGQAVNATSQLFSQPTGIALLPSGKLAIADNRAFTANKGGLIGVDPATGKQTTISSNDQAVNATSQFLEFPYDLISDGRGNLLVASSEGFTTNDGAILKVKLATGKQTVLSSNEMPVNASTKFFEDPSDLVRTPAGKIFVTDDSAFDDGNGGVIRINPRTGKQILVSNNLQSINSSNPMLGNPYGIALDLLGRFVLTNETYTLSGPPSNDGTVIRVKPRNGKLSLVSSNLQTVNAGSSELLDYPNGVLVVPPKCAGRYATIVGSPKKDKLRGTRFPDVIAGLGGGDVIRGLRGNDRLCGGKGRDKLLGGPGRDVQVP